MTQYVRAINITNNSIKAFVFDTNTSNTLNTAVVASAVAISANVSAQAVNTFVTLQVQQVANTPPTINVITITDSSYIPLDDTAANTTGAFLRITGSNFQSGAIVMVGSTNTAISTTFVDSSTLRAQIPAIAAGTYPVYVVNTNGGTAIRINGLTTSPFPAWSTGATLASQNSAVAFAISLSANSDSNITYSNTTPLPAGTTLAANGLFSGTVILDSTTTYSFTVRATDVELQDASRTFSVTVTLPSYSLWGYGFNTLGALGLNNVISRSSPVQIGSDTNWSSASSGAYHSGGVKTNKTLWLWGFNAYGELGVNDRINKSSPTQVGTDTNWNLISCGYYFTTSIKTNGTLWTWGRGLNGALGLNSIFYRSSPTQIGTDTNWLSIQSSKFSGFTISVKTDGTLWSWGENTNGQLGTNDRVARSSPTQVGTGTNWSSVSLGRFSAIATKTDGTLWSWGQGRYGTLGLNSETYRSSPTQVGVATNWSLISSGRHTSSAIKTDGTLWTWGLNNYGDIGLNDRVARSSPTQVGVTTNWSLISSSSYSSSAIKTDGTLWTWGDDGWGVLATIGSPRSSPVQVGTDTNWKKSFSGSSTLLFK